MARIPAHSTRLMGFHLRNFRSAEGDESEMFSARIYLGEQEIGFARNEGSGGPDLIHIDREHRPAWERLARYMDEHPMSVTDDGAPEMTMSGDEAAMIVLREIHHAEHDLSRSRKYRSGLLGFTWTEPFKGSGWWATATVLLTGAESVAPEDADPDVFWILVLGRDNERFARETAPPPVRQQS